MTLKVMMELGQEAPGHQAYGAVVSLAQTASCSYLYTNCVRAQDLVGVGRGWGKVSTQKGELTNTRGKHACGWLQGEGIDAAWEGKGNEMGWKLGGEPR